MTRRMHIERVDASQADSALLFLAAGRRADVAGKARADAYARMLRTGRHEKADLWLARRGGRCMAAALVLDNPGRTAVLFHSSAEAPGVDDDALREVVSTAAAESLERDRVFVQSLEPLGAPRDVEILGRAGFEYLAELIYMQRPLLSECPGAPPEDPDLCLRPYGRFDEPELARIIEATYVGSKDCPALAGVRSVADVIEGHKASGVFCPRTWWVADLHGEPAGCILANDLSYISASDVVYLGVLPDCRGQGLCGRMLDQAAWQVRKRGRAMLTLAVDSLNGYAYQVYLRKGFTATDHRGAYVRRGSKTPHEAGD